LAHRVSVRSPGGSKARAKSAKGHRGLLRRAVDREGSEPTDGRGPDRHDGGCQDATKLVSPPPPAAAAEEASSRARRRWVQSSCLRSGVHTLAVRRCAAMSTSSAGAPMVPADTQACRRAAGECGRISGAGEREPAAARAGTQRRRRTV
jgi:hypothetical protein